VIKCKNCKFYLDMKQECRCNPPLLDNNGYACWPVIKNPEENGCFKGMGKSSTIINEIMGDVE